MKYCEQTIEKEGYKTYYYKCNRKAKYITPKCLITGKQIFVCGIHKRAIDKMYANLGIDEKCEEIEEF